MELQDVIDSPEYQSLTVAAAGRPERSIGEPGNESVIPAEPPRWKEVLQLADALYDNAPGHLPTLVYRVRGQIETAGFNGLEVGLCEIDELLRDSWDSLYPPADKDDEDDPYYERVNLLRGLSEAPDLHRSLTSSILFDVRGIGAFNSRHLAIAAGKIQGNDEEHQLGQAGLISAALEQMEPGRLQALDSALANSLSHADSINSTVAEKCGSFGADVLGHLRRKIDDIHKGYLEIVDSQLLVQSETDSQSAASDTANGNATAAAKGSSDAGESAATADSMAQLSNGDAMRFASRGELVEGLDAVVAYYLDHEPSSPVGVFAARARDMVSKQFFDIVDDLCPGGGDSLAERLDSIRKKPLKHVLQDSYKRFAQGGVTANGVASPSLKTRSEAQQILADVEAWLRDREPSSPVPLLVAEMRRLMLCSFTDIVAEFAQTAGDGSNDAVKPNE